MRQTQRTFRRRIASVTVDELRRLHDWSLLGGRLSRLTQADRFYVVAKVELETDEPVYPCRPSDAPGRAAEVPVWDQSRCTYPTGRFTTWLRPNEIRHALAHNRLTRCFEAIIAVINVEDQQQWRQVRRKILWLYGRICIRFGSTAGEMHVDHIKPWAKYPDRRYDPDNLQVLCRECHVWKEAQGTEMDFRPYTSKPRR